jgi:hypothetical protein
MSGGRSRRVTGRALVNAAVNVRAALRREGAEGGGWVGGAPGWVPLANCPSRPAHMR